MAAPPTEPVDLQAAASWELLAEERGCCKGLQEWLTQHGLESYFKEFADIAEEVGCDRVEDFLLLDESDLEQSLGLKKVAMAKLAKAKDALRGSPGEKGSSTAQSLDALVKELMAKLQGQPIQLLPREFTASERLPQIQALAPVMAEQASLLKDEEQVIASLFAVVLSHLKEYAKRAQDLWTLEDIVREANLTACDADTETYADVHSRIKAEDAGYEDLGPMLQAIQASVVQYDGGVGQIADPLERILTAHEVGARLKTNCVEPLIGAVSERIGREDAPVQTTVASEGIRRVLAAERLALRPDGPASRVAVRALVVCSNVAQIATAAQFTVGYPGVRLIELRDCFSSPRRGWADVTMYVQFDDAECQGGVAEVQLAHAMLMAARRDFGGRGSHEDGRVAAELANLIGTACRVASPCGQPGSSVDIDGDYISFKTGGSSASVVDRFRAKTSGGVVTYFRNQKACESYTISGNVLNGAVSATIQPNGDIVYSHGYTSRKVASPSNQSAGSGGTIEFLGLWKDSHDRAMPIKMGVNASQPSQIRDAFHKLVTEMRHNGVSSGILAAQSYNQMHWSANPGEQGYMKHGYIGNSPERAIRSTFSGREHRREGIRFDGFTGAINILGGDWQNAVYRVTLGGGSGDVSVKHIKPGPRLTHADSEACARKMNGRLLTLEEAREFMSGRGALYPGEDQWCAVQGRDWVQVGSRHHHPGKSHCIDCGHYPPWGDDASDKTYGDATWNYVVLYSTDSRPKACDEAAGGDVALSGWSGYNARLNGVYTPNGESVNGKPVFSHAHHEGVGAGCDWCRMWYAHGAWRIGHFLWVHGDNELAVAYVKSDAAHPRQIEPEARWLEHKGTVAGRDFGRNEDDFTHNGGVRVAEHKFEGVAEQGVRGAAWRGIEGDYFSFKTGEGPAHVVDRCRVKRCGDHVTFCRNQAKPGPCAQPGPIPDGPGCTISGNVLVSAGYPHHSATIQPNGDIVWSFGYTTRRAGGAARARATGCWAQMAGCFASIRGAAGI